MTVNTFNYTDRRRLRHRDTEILLHRDGFGGRFEADIRLNEYGLPGDAAVFVEAYRRTYLQRFDFGTAAAPRPKSECIIAGTAEIGAILFRVKVVGPTGIILAEADGIQPSDMAPDSRRSFIHVREDDLSGELWTLELDEDPPILVIEKRYGPKEMLLNSPHFMWLVLPTILRMLLRHTLDHEPNEESEEEAGSSWKVTLIEQATRHAKEPRPDNPEDHADWIDNAVRGFCQSSDFPQKLGPKIFGELNS